MSRELLREFFRGKVKAKDVLENFLSPGSIGDLTTVNRTGRDEKHAEAWRNLLINLEALWLDVLDEDPDTYEAANPVLQQIRRTPPNACRGVIGQFQQLSDLLAQVGADDQELALYASRMEQLQVELQYVCEVFEPEKEPLPGAPLKSKKEWEKTQQPDQNQTLAQPNQVGPDGQPQQIVPDQEQNPDQAMQNGEEVPPQDEIVPDQEQIPGQEQPTQEIPGEEMPDQEEVPPQDGEEVPGEEEAPEQMPQGQAMQPQKPKLPIQAPSGDEEWAGDFQQDIQQQQPPGMKPSQPAPQEEPDGDESDEEDDSRPFPPKKKVETRESTLPVTGSLVLSAFQRATDIMAESVNSLEAEAIEAAETLRIAMEEHSDVSSAYTELGSLCPGNPPRVDLYVEWEIDGKPTDCYGYARLHLVENVLQVRDSNDTLRGEITLREGMEDSDVVETIYSSLTTVQDGNLHRIFHKGGVIKSIYGLLEKNNNGCPLPEHSFALAVAHLRPRIGLNEAVRVVPQDISIKLDEDVSDMWGYYFDWSVRTPLTHLHLPDEIGFDTMDEPVPQDVFDIEDDDEFMDEFEALEILSGMEDSEIKDIALELGIVDDDENMDRSSLIPQILDVWTDESEDFLGERSATKTAPPGLAKGDYYRYLGKTPWGDKPHGGNRLKGSKVKSKIAKKASSKKPSAKKGKKDDISKWNKASKFRRLFMKRPGTKGKQNFLTKKHSLGGLVKGAAKAVGKGAVGVAKHLATTAKGAWKGKFERKEGAYAEHWRTPVLGISMKDRKVYFLSEKGKEELPPETTDEDISARLASMAYQKEVQEGHLIEGSKAQINRRDVLRLIETPMGPALEYDLEDLNAMSTDELWSLAVSAGIKVPGDGVTFDRAKLISALLGVVVF